MEMNTYKNILYLAQYENMSTVSKLLHISQPALSLSLKKFEKEVGKSIFDRHGRSIKLNKFGEALLPHIKKIIEEEAIILNKQTLAFDQSLTVGITHYPYFYAFVIPFKALYPNIKVNSVMGTESELTEKLQQGSIDVLLAAPTFQDEAFISEKIVDDPLYVAVGLSNMLSRNSTITPHELATQPLISLPPTYEYGQFIDQLQQKLEVPFNISMIEKDPILVSNELVSGASAMIFTETDRCISAYLSLHFIKLKSPDAFKSFFVTHHKYLTVGAGQLFIQHVKDHYS